MSTLTKDQLRVLRADINAALVSVAEKHQLKELVAGNCSYTTTGAFTFKVEGVIPGGMDKVAAAYESERQWDKNLPPLGAEFSYGGVEYRIAGCKSRGGRIIATRTRDEKDFVFNRDVLLALVAKTAAAQP